MTKNISNILRGIQLCSEQMLPIVNKHLITIMNLIELDQHKESPAYHTHQPHHPSNKNITPQRPFTSTGKRPNKATVRIVKPDNEESQVMISLLRSNTPLYMSEQEVSSKC
jgi:hypothetical protein